MTRLVALLSALVLLLAAPAAAETRHVADPAGDAVVDQAGPGLDVTGATVDNRQRRLVVTVAFAAIERGALVVSVEARGGDGLRMISKFRPGHRARSFVVPGSFAPLRVRGASCKRYAVTWDRAAATATMSLPPRCLAGGAYDAVRVGVLTEADAGDTDYAPEDLTSGWIDRG